LDATKIFINKGIKTHASSANKKDVTSRDVYLILYFDSLNENNKKIIEKEKYEIYEQQFFKKIKLVKITMPITNKTTVGEVREEFIKIANLFENQIKF
jgi:hypothetical protein